MKRHQWSGQLTRDLSAPDRLRRSNDLEAVSKRGGRDRVRRRPGNLLLPRRSVAASTVACIVFFATTALARPCADVRADYALGEATLVVKGWLESTKNSRVPESDSISVIRVDRVLKGSTSRTAISVTHFLCGLEYRLAMRADRPLIAFVTASGGLVGGTAVLPASPRSAGDASSDATANLRAELLLASTDDDPGVVRAAVGALAELDHVGSVPVLERAAQSADFGVRVRALSWLTQFGDVVAFSELAKMLSEWPFTPFAIPSTIHDDNNASLAIAYDDVIRSLSSFGAGDVGVSTAPRINTTAFVEIMTTLAQSDDIHIRGAASLALRAFKAPGTSR